MKIVKYFDDVFEAAVARELLEAEGIKAVVLNENSNWVLPMTLAISSLRPHVVVADEDLEAAMKVLGIEQDGEPKPVTCCPECGSTDFKYTFPKYNDKVRRFTRYILLPLMFLNLTGAGTLRRVYHCIECGHEFRVR